MQASEYRKAIDRAAAMIVAATPKAETPAEAQMAELVGIGIVVLGELLMDIKRIADAAESPPIRGRVQPTKPNSPPK